jgi:hypothetical protein
LRFDFCTTKSSPQFGSTDAAANVLDDFHVGFQRSGGIFAFPRDTSLGRHGRRDWAKHDIFVREFFKLLGHEGDTQAGGDGVDHRSFKIDILQNLRRKTCARLAVGWTVTHIQLDRGV